MTREEAIARIELAATELTGTLAATTEPSAAEVLQRYIDAYDMAISALREQEEREKTSADAFGDIAWYNGHVEWLETIRKEMLECDGFYMCPVRPAEWNTDKHALWMFLCGMFGNWGVSIRAGWIEEKEKAAAFIEKAVGKFRGGFEE